MTVKEISLDYEPRDAFMPFHARTARNSILVCHRRAGKTVAVVNDMVMRALSTPKPDAFYAYIAPTYGQAKNIAWMYIKKAIRNMPKGMVKISESETSIKLPNGARIRVFGIDNPDALRGLYFDGVVCDEYGEWKSRAYTEVIRPALSERQGWTVFIGTPKGPSNSFARLWEKAPARGWCTLMLKASESGLLPASEIAAMREDMDPEEVEQELECSFQAAVKGSYYGKHVEELERRGQIAEVPYDPTEPVSLAMDIGYADATAIWFWQVIDGTVRFFDYFEATGMDAEETIEKLQLLPYEYDAMFLPHDANARTFRSKKAVIDSFREANIPARLVPRLDLKDGIDAVRKTLRTYPVAFDAVACSKGLKCLRNYTRKWSKDSGVFSNTPDHDQWSHGADAFRYASLVINPSTIEVSRERAERKRAQVKATVTVELNTNRTPYTFKDAWAEHDRQMAAQRAEGRARI